MHDVKSFCYPTALTVCSSPRYLTDGKKAISVNAKENIADSDESVVDSDDMSDEEQDVNISDQDGNSDADRAHVDIDICVARHDKL
jgi:hypothetical protein